RWDSKRAGRRGSSEDDLPLRLNRTPDRDAGRGLNPTPDERGPAPLQHRRGSEPKATLAHPEIARQLSALGQLLELGEPAVRGRLRRGGLQSLRQLPQRQRRVPGSQRGDLTQLGSEMLEPPVRLETTDGAKLRIRGAAPRGAVCGVCVGWPVCPARA